MKADTPSFSIQPHLEAAQAMRAKALAAAQQLKEPARQAVDDATQTLRLEIDDLIKRLRNELKKRLDEGDTSDDLKQLLSLFRGEIAKIPTGLPTFLEQHHLDALNALWSKVQAPSNTTGALKAQALRAGQREEAERGDKNNTGHKALVVAVDSSLASHRSQHYFKQQFTHRQ